MMITKTTHLSLNSAGSKNKNIWDFRLNTVKMCPYKRPWGNKWFVAVCNCMLHENYSIYKSFTNDEGVCSSFIFI